MKILSMIHAPHRRARRPVEFYVVAVVSLFLLVLAFRTPRDRENTAGSVEKRPASAEAWATRAEQLLAAGQREQAARAIGRAVELAPRIPAIAMRAVHIYMVLENRDQLLSSTVSVLRDTTTYDVILFQYLEDAAFDPVYVVQYLGQNKRAQLAWFNYLCYKPRGDNRARAVWQWLARNDAITPESLVAYANYLIRQEAVGEAAAEWARWNRKSHPAYMQSTQIFDGSFEHAPGTSPFDWRIAPHPSVTAAIDSGALAMTFNGTENLSYNHVSQLVWLPAGSYTLAASVRANGLTTDQGVYIETCGARTPAVLGTTTGWSRITADLAVPRDTACQVRVCRDRSRKIDSKIAGQVWIDNVALTRR